MPKKRADRNSPEYWERVLKVHGLGMDGSVQTDHSDEIIIDEPVFQSAQHISGRSQREIDVQKLLRQFGGKDGFIDGHQIQKVKKNAGNQHVQEWAFDDNKVRTLLLSVFPKLLTDQKQRVRAARWLRIIHLYYRMGLPHPAVAKEVGVSYTALMSLLRSITRATQGRRANGTGKKTRAILQTYNESPEGTGREENDRV